MRRWNDAKLEKEIAFARGFDDPSPAAREWLRKLEAEKARREA